MSANAIRGKGTAPARPSDSEIAIGDVDRQIFNCPACQRPLATGATRCPGCGTRLVFGLQAAKATSLFGSGAITGALVGGLLVALVLLAVQPGTAIVPVVPGDEPLPTTPGSTLPPPVPVSRAVSNALVRTYGLNGRMAGQLASLSAAVKPSKPKTSDVARILRAIASDASLAASAVPDLAAWAAGRDLAEELRTFYANVRATASTALAQSLNDSAAYRRNGLKMVALLKAIGALQSTTEIIAEAYGIDLVT